MLGSLRGTVTTHLDQRILVEVGGIGYWVHTGSWQPDGEVTCFLHHHVREEASDLYGFESLSALQLFEKLLSISGIGPKAGLALLSLGSTERILQAIANRDVTFLTGAPGIGTKAAQKIILELQDKVGLISSSSGAGLPVSEEILSALESLGYKAAEVRPFVQELPPEHATLDTQLKWVLQQLGKRS